MLMLRAHRDKQVRKTRKTGARTKVTDGMHIPWEAACRRWRQFSLHKTHRRQAASHSPWSQQDSGITLSTSMSMIGVLEITLIVPT
ncbi:hypothetical protein, partial [Pseudomonas viridiflava]|uniref:hypothetical protein n=1 Tax=Pseudomonas viridiflava TaxID=33069 RepID=UPI00198152E9